MVKWIRQLFCNHYYKVSKRIEASFIVRDVKYPVPITIYRCKYCKRVIITRDDDFCYSPSLLKKLKLLKKGYIMEEDL